MATVSFLFWNIRRALGTRFHESLRRLTHRGIDVFLFAEPPADDQRLLKAMNEGFGGTYYRVVSESRRLMLFSRFPERFWIDRFSGDVNDRFTAHELTHELIVDNYLGILLIGAHLHAPNVHDIHTRAEWARKLAPRVRQIEDDVGHARTVLVGDLNMNPFDRGLVDTTALHALMSRPLTESVQRMKSRRGYLPFYNPMWSLLGDRIGDRSDEPRSAGTYFHESSQALASHFWQMFDQLLLRPDLMKSLSQLEILASDGQDWLVSRSGRPRRAAVSDHLPLCFDLILPEGGMT